VGDYIDENEVSKTSADGDEEYDKEDDEINAAKTYGHEMEMHYYHPQPTYHEPEHYHPAPQYHHPEPEHDHYSKPEKESKKKKKHKKHKKKKVYVPVFVPEKQKKKS